jgi:hypothetical protein
VTGRATASGLVAALAVAGAAYVAGPSSAAGDGDQRRPVAGTHCPTFPANNYWHADVRHLPVNPRSRQWLSHMSRSVDLHPDFGPSFGNGPDYGIPVTVVGHSHRRVKVHFRYARESDRVRYPLGADTRIEGGRRSDGDRHAIIVDRGSCRLYETFATRKRDGRWTAGSGAVWSLTSNALRPNSWTSADAAGLPILPGLLRWNEVKNRNVDHAIRFTTDVTSKHHVWPARHDAGSRRSLAYPPMGARFRLRASYHPAGFGPAAKAVVKAMKTYGLVLADNGSPWFFQGEQNASWPIGMIEDLKRIPARAFVAVDTAPLKLSGNSGATQ